MAELAEAGVTYPCWHTKTTPQIVQLSLRAKCRPADRLSARKKGGHGPFRPTPQLGDPQAGGCYNHDIPLRHEGSRPLTGTKSTSLHKIWLWKISGASLWQGSGAWGTKTLFFKRSAQTHLFQVQYGGSSLKSTQGRCQRGRDLVKLLPGTEVMARAPFLRSFQIAGLVLIGPFPPFQSS